MDALFKKLLRKHRGGMEKNVCASDIGDLMV